MDFGEKIKKLRLERGMTLEQVGNIVGVGKSTVRKWETGDIANMRRDKIELLANALCVEPSYLMGWTDEHVELVLSKDEIDLVMEYRAAIPMARDMARNTLRSYPAEKKASLA
jgi:transcriptional regulator with XRE-family HTH domain